MKLRKILTAVLSIIMLTGCNTTTKQTTENKKIQIVATTYPQYNWIQEIVGKDNDKFDVTLLMKNGSDLHSFQPTASDITKIADANLFVYVGGESDEWVEDALKQTNNSDMHVVNMLESIGSRAVEEEEKEGMQAEEEEEHEHDHDEVEYDEHVWLSLKNAQVLVKKISEEIISLDEENESKYQANTDAYIAKLSSLDDEYQATIDQASQKTLIFGDRFPFRYMVDDYGLDYYAAFVGCSAETEASFETVAFLAKKVDELKVNHVLTIEGSDQKIAKTIINNTTEKNQDILTLNSLQSVSQKDNENGISYYDVMKENLSVLAKALDTEAQ
ncbi:MAG: metal ABC transporter substrate-binding protein [Erysipelotrichaceae bacterium]|nr:metal ABC transporter substrate-binding protein [Erysipelotrichaceae bacterium]